MSERLLALRDLHVSLAGRPVLVGVDLELGHGELLGLIGAGGAGKSVLVKVCCGLLPAQRGLVEVLGLDLSCADEDRLAALRERLGLAFQNYALFDFLDVAGNIAFPLRQHGRPEAEVAARVEASLAAVGLLPAAGLAPSALSGGMRRRVALARATIARPELAFYDDPTAGLDPVTSSKIFELIARSHRSQGSGALIVSHDIDRLCGICDRFALLESGRVAWTGTAPEARAASLASLRVFFAAGGGP